jgi:hypothetical protein
MSLVTAIVGVESDAADAVSGVSVAAMKSPATIGILASMLDSVVGEPAMIRLDQSRSALNEGRTARSFSLQRRHAAVDDRDRSGGDGAASLTERTSQQRCLTPRRRPRLQ